MTSRIEDGYREKFLALLARVRPKRLQFGVELLVDRARQLAVREGVPLPAALSSSTMRAPVAGSDSVVGTVDFLSQHHYGWI